MKFRFFCLTFFISLSLSIYGEEINKKEILESMVYPSPFLEIGSFINEPLFSISIHNENINIKEVKKSVAVIEKRLNLKSNPSDFLTLANNYKDLSDYENSIRYYDLYLKSINPESDNIQTKFTLGKIHYNLWLITTGAEKKFHLEKASIYLLNVSESLKDNTSLWIKLGDCHLSSDKTDDALYCYKKALEINPDNPVIPGRIKAAAFQRDYLKLIQKINPADTSVTVILNDRDIIELQNSIKADENSNNTEKLQNIIYTTRLLLIKKNLILSSDTSFNKEEKKILSDALLFIKNINNRNFNKWSIRYLSGIISYLMSDYKESLIILKSCLNGVRETDSIRDDILFIYLNCLKDSEETKKFILSSIWEKPSAENYFILSSIEYSSMNLPGAEFYCNQALKISNELPYIYSALSVIYASKGDYFAADQMIKKGNMLEHNVKYDKNKLYWQMKINEAAIALFKNEKERAYLLLRTVLTVDNNANATRLYNRYFTKNEQIQN